MLCRGCQGIFSSTDRRAGYHRTDYHAVDTDTELKSCVFCSWLRSDATRAALSSFPRYRWTVRPLPSRGEGRSSSHGLDCVVVTFRPVETESIVRPSRSDLFLLPHKFYLFRKDTIKVADDLGPTTALTPESSLPQIKRWMQECSRHKRCHTVHANSEPEFVPTRLVHVGTGSGPVYVVSTKTPGFKKERYVTLSHCWGETPIVRLVDANMHQFMDPGIGIPWESLSRTFQDAISVARTLGVRYIWIDSLCIVQWTPEGKGDFDVEGQLMHMVYRHSFCNIAAADSSDGSGGLFRIRKAEDALPATVQLEERWDMKGTWHVLPGNYWTEQLLDRALYKRGWVFQERMLSPRLLHFSATQVLWDCPTLSACEILYERIPQPLDAVPAMERHWRERLLKTRQDSSQSSFSKARSGSADDSLEDFWARSVLNYTRCSLRYYDQDRLLAIWGVAKLVRDGLREEEQAQREDPAFMEEEYAAGLWRKNLHNQLSWRVVNPGEASRPENLKHNPSWSWASTIAEIELQPELAGELWFRVQDHQGRDIAAEVVGSAVTGSLDTQPELADGKGAIAIKGPLAEGICTSDGEIWATQAGPLLADKAEKFRFYLDLSPDRVVSGGSTCFLLVTLAHATDREMSKVDAEDSQVAAVLTGAGLVLFPSDDGGRSNQYKRAGAFQFDTVDTKDMAWLFDESLLRDIWLC